jgi:hypothetical protein
MRVIYGTPPSNEPSGGVKVIYRHSEILNSLGVSSGIWVPADPSFSCDWFEHQVRFVATENLNPKEDFVVVPEIWASFYVPLLKNLGFRVGIFVQNSYLTHVNLAGDNKDGIRDAYGSADLILSISIDSTRYLVEILGVPRSKIVMQRYSVNRNLFRPKPKEPLITYMPRKMSDHASRVASILNGNLPAGWKIAAIDKLSEFQVAEVLSKSIIFLAFSEFEGLPVPPVEAALSGNIVIGYHGQGGREYWRRPNFVEVDQGDIQRFLFEIRDAISVVVSGQLNIDALNIGIEALGEYFSPSAERLMLGALIGATKCFYPPRALD